MKKILKEAFLRVPYKYRKVFYLLRDVYDYSGALIKPSSRNIFFIVGSQRSGTTLMRLILDSHCDLQVYDEGQSYNLITSLKFPQDSKVGFKIPRWTYRFNFLNKKYPNAKYIFVVRDVKSIAASMFNLIVPAGNIRWIEKVGVQEVEQSLSRISDLNVKSKLRTTFKKIRTSNDLISLAALCAYIKMRAGLGKLDRPLSENVAPIC